MKALLIFLSFFIGTGVHAQILGSDISWECLGNDSFLVKVEVYRNCSSDSLGANPLIVKCSAGDTLQIIPGTPLSLDATPRNNAKCNKCNDPGCSFPYGIERNTYLYRVDLSNIPAGCCKVNFTWSYCCRDSSLPVVTPNISFYTEAMVNTCLNYCEKSPPVENIPIIFHCLGNQLIYENAPSSIDTGAQTFDSLRYLMASPLISEKNILTYPGKYDSLIPINFWGFPNTTLPVPRGFHLDTFTGNLNLRPMKPELSVGTIKILFFKGNELVGYVRRELFFNIVSCSLNNPPEISGVGGTNSYIIEACAGDTIKFDFLSSDPDTTDSLYLSFNKGNLPGNPQVSFSKNRFPEGQFIWETKRSFATDGIMIFNFYIKATDTKSFPPLESTRVFNVKLYPHPHADISIIPKDCSFFGFEALNPVPSTPEYNWNVKDKNGSVVFQSYKRGGEFQLTDSGTFYVSMTMTKLCSDTFYDTIRIVQYPNIPPRPVITTNGSILISTPAFKYQWYKDGAPLSGDTLRSYFLTGAGEYFVKITDSAGCSAISDTISVLSLHENFSKPPVELYPNPAKDFVTLKFNLPFKNVLVELINLNGQVEKDFKISGITELNLPLAGIPPGIYIVKIANEGMVVTKRITKLK